MSKALVVGLALPSGFKVRGEDLDAAPWYNAQIWASDGCITVTIFLIMGEDEVREHNASLPTSDYGFVIGACNIVETEFGGEESAENDDEASEQDIADFKEEHDGLSWPQQCICLTVRLPRDYNPPLSENGLPFYLTLAKASDLDSAELDPEEDRLIAEVVLEDGNIERYGMTQTEFLDACVIDLQIQAIEEGMFWNDEESDDEGGDEDDAFVSPAPDFVPSSFVMDTGLARANSHFMRPDPGEA